MPEDVNKCQQMTTMLMFFRVLHVAPHGCRSMPAWAGRMKYIPKCQVRARVANHATSSRAGRMSFRFSLPVRLRSFAPGYPFKKAERNID